MMASCSPMPSAACLHQQGWNNNKKTILSIIRHDADPMIMKPLITTTRRVVFPPRLSIKAAAAASSSPVIVNKKQISPPWLMVTPEIELWSGTDTVFMFYSLAEDEVLTIDRQNLKDHLGLESSPITKLECRGSSHGWLVLYDTDSSDLFLYNPLSNRRLKLPSIRNLEAIRKDDLELMLGRPCVRKVIISSSDPEGDVDCRALMIHGRRGNLAFCCPSTSGEWIETYRCYDDVVCAGDNLFFGVNDDPPYPEFEGWDLRDVSRPMLISLEDSIVKDYGETFPWKGYDFKKERRARKANFLVAADGRQLFYVCLRCGKGDDLKNAHFHVHKFDFESGKLVDMDGSLDGLALFVGRNHSFALMPDDDDGVEPNSIYFTQLEEDYRLAPILGMHHIKIYDYADGSFDSTTLFDVAVPDWESGGIFFPDPPMWYTPTTT